MADPKIKYDIEAAVSGEKDINSLAQRLEDMGKILDSDLAPAAKVAATEMRALGEQQGAIVAFAKLSEQVKAAERDFALAEKSAKSFTADISAAGPPTAQQAATLGRLNEQVKNSETKLTEQKDALHGANQELLKYGLTGDRLIEAQRQTTASVDALKTSVQASIPVFKAAGTEGSTSARQISDAWHTLGTKSFSETQTELAKVRSALETVKATSKNPLEIKMATAAAQAQITKLEGGVTSVGTAATGLGSLLSTLGPLIAATFSAQQFIGAITSAESLTRSYEQIFGSTAKARQEMEFIKTTANNLGLETLDLAKSYQSLAASTRGTTLEGQATRDMFEAVTRAMSMMGKSSSETGNALNAVSQMASKGTVAMEELRGQLGEALPGALKAAADGAGITVEQLVAMVSTGNVLAKDMLPALTKGLNDLYANAPPPQTVVAEWARFKNVVTETSIAIGEGGASKGLAGALSSTVEGIGALHGATQQTGEALGELAFETVQATKSAVDYLAKLLPVDAAMKAVGLSTDKAAAAQVGLTAAQGKSVPTAQEAMRHQELLAQKLDTLGESTLKVQQRYDELTKGSAGHVAQIQKEIEARTAESALLTQLVNLYGTETEKRQVAVSVAQTQVAMAEKLAASQNVEVLIANSYVIKLREQAIATGDVTEATRKAIGEAQKSATAKQTEFEKTDALAKAKRIEAEASKAQELALKDNSARVWEYHGAMVAATTEVARLTALHQAGQATEEQVIAAKTKLASATLLYRDALSDASAKAETNMAVQQRAAQLSQASTSIDLEWARAEQEVAIAQGNNAQATQLATQITNLQVQASRDQAEAARAEAQAIRDLADKKEAEYKATGVLTEAQKNDIAARRQSADLKDIEAQKSDILTNKILALAAANSTETASLDAKNAALERTVAAQEKALDLAKRQKALDDAKNHVTADGWAADAQGNKISVTTPTERSTYENAKQQGLSEAQALQIKNQFWQNGQPVGGVEAGRNGSSWSVDIQRAIDQLVLANASKAATAGTGTSPDPNSLDKAAPDVKSLRDAYQLLGLKTTEELNRIAATNKAAWEHIRLDDTASAETLKTAFTTYAQSAIAASGNVGSAQRATTEETLKTEAATKGLNISFGAAGNWSVEVQKAIDQMALANAAKAAAGTSTPSAPNAVGKVYTVNINVGGVNTPVNTASDADAQALISVLQRAKLTSGL